jgi:hypothetical protein
MGLSVFKSLGEPEAFTSSKKVIHVLDTVGDWEDIKHLIVEGAPFTCQADALAEVKTIKEWVSYFLECILFLAMCFCELIVCMHHHVFSMIGWLISRQISVPMQALPSSHQLGILKGRSVCMPLYSMPRTQATVVLAKQQISMLILTTSIRWRRMTKVKSRACGRCGMMDIV